MIDLKYNPETGVWESSEQSTPETAEAAQPKAEARQALGGLTDLEIVGIPVGEALGGGVTAMLGTQLIDGVVGEGEDNEVTRGIVKLAASGATVALLSPMLGSGLSRSAAMFMAFDAVRDMIPLDDFINDLVGGLTPDSGSAAQRKRRTKRATAGQGQAQAAIQHTTGSTMSEDQMLDQAAQRVLARR